MDKKKESQISDLEVFNLIKKANDQYDVYLELTALDYNNPDEIEDVTFKRDINHPLNIVID